MLPLKNYLEDVHIVSTNSITEFVETPYYADSHLSKKLVNNLVIIQIQKQTFY